MKKFTVIFYTESGLGGGHLAVSCKFTTDRIHYRSTLAHSQFFSIRRNSDGKELTGIRETTHMGTTTANK